MKRYRVLDHTADLGLQILGRTVEELFANGAYALFDLIADLGQVELTSDRVITATGADWNDLWINYLRECLSVFNCAAFLMREIDVLSLDESQVNARLRGEPFQPDRHHLRQEIKAVTYHQASVRSTARGWRGRVILDV